MDEKKINFLQGIAIDDVPSGAIVRGVVDSEDAILVRRGDDFFFIGAQCSNHATAPSSTVAAAAPWQWLRLGAILRICAPSATWNWPRPAENVIPCPHKNVRVIWTDGIFW
jgi:hypothetical protein